MSSVLAKSVLLEFSRAKSNLGLSVVTAVMLALFLSVQAWAEESGYRSGQRFVEHPPIQILSSLTDGKEVLPTGSYRVRVRAGRMVFADAEMRQVALRLPCKFAVLPSNLATPKITQKKVGETWRIEYAYRAWRCAVTLKASLQEHEQRQQAQTLPEMHGETAGY